MMLKCSGDYDIETTCGWFGGDEECLKLNGHPICPDCGGNVEPMGEIPKLRLIKTQVRLPGEVAP